MALKVTPAHEQERAQVGELIKDVQEATGEKVEVSLLIKATPEKHPQNKPPVLPLWSSRGSQKGLCSSAKALGFRALLRLGRPLPTPCQRL